MDHEYIVWIGSEGLEAVVEITDFSADVIVDQLAGVNSKQVNKVTQAVTAMSFRARFNSHRNIHAYQIIVPYAEKEFSGYLQNSKELRELVATKGTKVNI